MTQRWWTAGFCLLLIVAGCHSRAAAPPRTYPVGGKVMLASGQPLSSGVVIFHPKNPPGNEAMGYIEKNGTFKMGTFGKEDGAIPGQYVVTIEPLAKRAPGGEVKPDVAGARVPRRYQEEETSPLTVEIRAGQNAVGPFRLQ